MKLITWNVNGIRACGKKAFVPFVERICPDILCVQETKAHPDQLDETLLRPCDLTESYFSSATRKGYSGTATFLKKAPDEVKYGIGIKKFDSEGRFVITRQSGFLLYNVYFPNGGAREERHLFKQEFLRKFQDHLRKDLERGEKVVLVGDYNVAYMDIDVHDPVRLSKISGFLPEEREWFRNFLEMGFVDVFRHFYPAVTDKYTWWSYRENGRIGNRGWRIDHICVSQNMMDRVVDIEIMDQQIGSDHCPVMVELKDN